MACKVPYIENRYRDKYPKLADRLNQVHDDIKQEIKNSKLFRDYSGVYLFSGKTTKSYQKQVAFIQSVNDKYGAKVAYEKLTKSGKNYFVAVNVVPLEKKEFARIQGQLDLFDQPAEVTQPEVEEEEPISEEEYLNSLPTEEEQLELDHIQRQDSGNWRDEDGDIKLYDDKRYKQFLSNSLLQDNRESLQDGLNWLRIVLPNADIRLVNGLIDNIARGSYNTITDLIEASKQFADKGVIKHEAGHFVFNNLPKSEQEKLLNEGSKLFGISRGESKTTVRYSQAQQNEIQYTLRSIDTLNNLTFSSPRLKYEGDLAIEEKIMERLEKSSDSYHPSTVIGKFFKAIKDFLRDLFKQRDKVQRFIDDVNGGKYRDLQRPNNLSNSASKLRSEIKYSLNLPNDRSGKNKINTQLLGKSQWNRFREHIKKDILSESEGSSILESIQRLSEVSFSDIFSKDYSEQERRLYASGRLYQSFYENDFLQRLLQHLQKDYNDPIIKLQNNPDSGFAGVLGNNIIINFGSIQILPFFNNLYEQGINLDEFTNAAAFEELIHFIVANKMNEELLGNAFQEFVQSHKNPSYRTTQYYNESLTQPHLFNTRDTQFVLFNEFIRIFVQKNFLDGKSTEDIKYNKTPFGTELLRRLLQFLSDFLKNSKYNKELKSAVDDYIINLTDNKNSNRNSTLLPLSDKQLTTQQSEAIGFVFEQNPELAKIGTQEQYSQYLNSLNKPNTNSILQNNRQEQIKKFAELQERLNNKEFLEGAKYAYESTPALQQFGAQEKYTDYIARVSLGIIKNPSSGDYNYNSRVKDIVYHGTDKNIEIFQKRDGIHFGNKSAALGLIEEKFGLFNEDDGALDNAIRNKIIYLTPSLLNITNLIKSKDIGTGWDFLNKNGVDGVSYFAVEGGQSYAVFEPEQIHVLGGKNDIEWFKDFVQDKQFQRLTAEEKAKTIEQVTKEHRSITALKDLAHKIAHRIGGEVGFVNKTDVDWKGYRQGNTFVLNEAYMTPDTPFHEVAHMIIGVIKNKTNFKNLDNFITAGPYNYGTEENPKFQYLLGFINDKLLQEKVKYLFDKKYDEEYNEEYYVKEFTSEKEAIDFAKKLKNELFKLSSKLYQSLLKELETGRGKEVFEQVKRDYPISKITYDLITIKDGISTTLDTFNTEEEAKENNAKNNYQYRVVKRTPPQGIFTEENQQEEAIVTLLGELAAGKLEEKENATLKKKLLEFWKQISDFVRQLLLQDEIRIDELPITTTLNDLAEIMAYGNNKIILPGYKVEYSTPLGNKYDTLEEVNNEIRGLADANVEVDLSGVKLKLDEIPERFESPRSGEEFEGWRVWKDKENQWWEWIEGEEPEIITKEKALELWKQLSEFEVFGVKNELTTEKTLHDFVHKNKEYEQSKEIIEQWKKENNIQYDPEEVYSRGHQFISTMGAFGKVDLELLFQNMLQHLEDYNRIGAKFELSFHTAPIDNRQVVDINQGGGKVYIVAYPQSNDIAWASKRDNASGSVWEANKKVSDKPSEIAGVAHTKAPSVHSINTIEPNLATIIDERNWARNELGIAVTTTNHRVEYDESVPYNIKKLIDNYNKILDDKYGKLVKPEVKKPISDKYGELKVTASKAFENKVVSEKLGVLENFRTSREAFDYIKNIKKEEGVSLPIQPTQTRENTTSIESVKNKIDDGTFGIKSLTARLKYEQNKIKILQADIDTNLNVEESKKAIEKTKKEISRLEGLIKTPPQKEYTSQALTNLKIAALKEVARKYPRSLITSKVVPINPNLIDSNEIQYSKVGFQTDIKGFKEFVTGKQQSAIPQDYQSFKQSLFTIDTNPELINKGDELIDEDGKECKL